MNNELLNLGEAAERLSVTSETLNRWHHANWAAATDYEVVFVPGAGRVSARRWKASAIEELSARRGEIIALDEELRVIRPLCRKFGKEHARALLEGASEPPPLPLPEKISTAAMDHSGIPICAKDAVAGFLRQSHSCATAALKRSFGIELAGCELDVSWYQLSPREYWSPFNFGSSHGGRKGERYYVKVMAGVRLSTVSDFHALFSRTYARNEYDFIASDPEIGSKAGLTAFQVVLITYLHEIAHAAAYWLKDHDRQLPPEIVSAENIARYASAVEYEKKPSSGHDINWSALYRALVRLSLKQSSLTKASASS